MGKYIIYLAFFYTNLIVLSVISGILTVSSFISLIGAAVAVYTKLDKIKSKILK